MALGLERLEDRMNPAAGVREQYMLELVNRMRENPAAELPLLLHSSDVDVNSALSYFHVNQTVLQTQWTSLTPVPPLAWSDTIAAVSLNYSNTMAAANQQDHFLNGSDPGTRLSDGGYNWNAYAENIFNQASSVFEAHAAFAIDWGFSPNGIQSPPGHRDNIMSADYREMGIGIVEDADANSGPLVITQDFGRAFNFGNPYLLGTIYNEQNANGYYDQGEGLANVTLTIEKAGTTWTTTTSAAGGYQIQLPAGTYQVTASGGQLASPQTFTVVIGGNNVHRNVIGNLAPNVLPVLNTISDQNLAPTVTTITIPLIASDADGGTLTYSGAIVRGGAAFDLDDQLGLVFQGTYSVNLRGANEKWMKSSVNGSLYFILPSGELRKWNGASGDLMANSTSEANLDPTFWLNPALLHDATTRALPSVTVAVTGNQMKLTLPAGLFGTFAVKANVSDGRDTVSQTFFVNREAATTTKVVGSLTTGSFGQPVTFTASVTSPAGNPPSGPIALIATNLDTSGTINLGSGTLNTVGQFAVTVATLPVGRWSVKAEFAGIGNYLSSSATLGSYVVTKGTSVTKLVASPATGLLYGQAVTLTATVTSSKSTSVFASNGSSVFFYDGPVSNASLLGTSVVANGVASIILPPGQLAARSHALTAVFGGDASLNGSQGTIPAYVVGKATTRADVLIAGTPTFGNTMTFDITVGATSLGTPGVPTGKVQVYDLSTATVLALQDVNGAGVYSFATSSLTAGTHVLQITYQGSTNFATSVVKLPTFTVAKAQTAVTSLLTSGSPSTAGQPVTFTAQVVSTDSPVAVVGGSVAFRRDATLLGYGAVNASGVAKFVALALPVGDWTISAQYLGSAIYQASVATTVSQKVLKSVIITRTLTNTIPFFGQSTTLAVSVAGAGGIPSGNVSVYDGVVSAGRLLNQKSLDGAGKVNGGFTLTLPSAGARNLVIVYEGDAAFGRTVSTIPLTVRKLPTTTTLAATTPVSYGQPATFVATLGIQGNPVLPVGSVVRFYDGATLLGESPVNAVTSKASFTTGSTQLAAGTHFITARYFEPSGNYVASVSAAAVQRVNPASTSVLLQSSSSTSLFANAVTFTATVSTSTGFVPTSGTVAFYDGTTLLGYGTLNGSNVASFVAVSGRLKIGTHSIRANFLATANLLLGSSPILIQTVQ